LTTDPDRPEQLATDAETIAAADRPDTTAGRAANVKQIRGSSLLLLGRVFGLAIDFVAQVLIVRYLTKSDYGAYALALALVAVGTTICLLGLDRTLGRFAPIYEEEGDYGRMWGTIGTIVVTVGTLGVAVVLAVHALQGLMGGVIGDELALSILLVMILLAPLQAIDGLLIAMFAVFGSARSIFFRRYVFASLLQLGVVVALIASDSDVRTLALGYVAVAALGIAVYLVVLLGLLRRKGLIARLRRDTIRLPIREVFGFSLPLLASDLVLVLRGSITILLLEVMRSTEEVAEFRAVLPIAIQMLFVAHSFRLIFTPGASRLYARGDSVALNDLYWQTAAWIAILTFPVFVVGLALAEPISLLLFGEPYRGTGGMLSVLVLGYYVTGAVGFNSLVLRVFGRVRFMLLTDLITAAVGLVATVLLIRSFGALGAGIGTSLSLFVQIAFYQWGLRTRTTVHAFDRRYLRAYASIAVGAAAAVVIQYVLQPPLLVGLVLAGLVSLLVVGLNRNALRVIETFPELARFGLARRLFGGTGG
jgi:O-antigen/teichoic acid export membrane protein